MNNRRKLLITLGAGSLAAPLLPFALPPGKIWRVGYLSSRIRPDSLDSGTAGSFRQGMRELGYVEGQNLMIEWRYAEEKTERLPSLVAELLQIESGRDFGRWYRACRCGTEGDYYDSYRHGKQR